MNKTGLIVVGLLLLLAGVGLGFVVASLVRPSEAGSGETTNLRTELADVRAELHRTREDAEAARTELSRSKADADLKWARQVAELFLNSVGEGEEGPALAVCTKECRARQMGFTGYMTFIPDRVGKLTWSITSHEASVARDRVVYRGTLTHASDLAPWRTRGFQLMMVKGNGGDWQVSGFTLQTKDGP
jgi:hypothetical protein